MGCDLEKDDCMNEPLWCDSGEASFVGVVVSSLALHHSDPGSIPGSAYRQFGFMPKMEVHTCYNSQKVTAASV